jgi:ubiquinone/menaquinone biosynthesis C-methylase UbiE
VTGVNITSAIVERARSTFPSSSYPNLAFAAGNATDLSEFKDNSFDILHAHQLFVHLYEPVKAMSEFYRVCKPGGIVACREGNGRRILSLNRTCLPSGSIGITRSLTWIRAVDISMLERAWRSG